MTRHFFGGFAADTRAKRVLETFWRFFFYTCAFAYGLHVRFSIFSFIYLFIHLSVTQKHNDEGFIMLLGKIIRFCSNPKKKSSAAQIMRKKAWLHDVNQCWIGYPTHTVDEDVW